MTTQFKISDGSKVLVGAFKISDGNTKLIDTIIFNLPAKITCPGATQLCAKHCYAMKAQVQYPATRDARQHNLDLVRDNPYWHGDLISQLHQKLQRAKKTFKYFRIHESGDFFSQKYVDSWVKVCAAFPEIQFLAYTKSHQFNFTALAALPNVTVRYSVWQDTKPNHIPADLPLALMEGVFPTTPPNTHACKPGDKCGPCRFCWASDKDVQFSLH